MATLPNTLTNGTLADADEVMDDLNALNSEGSNALAALLAPSKRTILSGLTMTASGSPDLNVTIAAGYFVGSDGLVKTYAGGTATFTSASGANPRFDLVTIDNAGTLTVTAGTAAAEPDMPTQPANSTVIGYAFRNTSDNTIATTDLYDIRVIPCGPGMNLIAKWDFETAATANHYAQVLFNTCDAVYSQIRMVIMASDTSQTSGLTQNVRINNLATSVYDYAYIIPTNTVTDYSAAVSQPAWVLTGADYGSTQWGTWDGTLRWVTDPTTTTNWKVALSGVHSGPVSIGEQTTLTYQANMTVAKSSGVNAISFQRATSGNYLKISVYGIK